MILPFTREPQRERVTRSHLVEFRAPGVCGAASAMRSAAAWLDEHPNPSVLAIYTDYDVEADGTVLTVVVQDFHDEELERLIGRRP